MYVLVQYQGQSESKKRSTSLETKGTAMSFGFKKKSLPSKKKQAKCDAQNANIVRDSSLESDDNGNSGE